MAAKTWADVHRQNKQDAVQTAKALREMNASFADRDNRVNGYAGSAARILTRISTQNCAATFGTSGGNCVSQ